MNDNKNMLERVLLMMKYDSSKTLKENSDVVRNEFAQQLNEAPRFRAKGKPKPKLSTPKAPRVSPTKITPSGLTVANIKSQVATYAKTPLSNGKLPTPAQQVAYGKQLAAGKVAPKAGATVTTTTTTTVGGGKPSGKIGGKTTTTGGRKPRKTPTPKDKSILARIGNNIKNNKGKWALAIAGLGLTSAGIYYYLQPKVSPCLLDSLSEEELASLGATGTTGKISRAQVGNRIADLNGGLSFNMDNNTVTTGNGKYSGSYSCDGNAIKVSIAGADFTLGSTGNADTGTSGGGGGGSRYKQCAETFPIAMNCKNSTIARVQGCLGIKQDGAFGPNTSSALVAKGADGSSITQVSVDKVCGPAAAAKIEKLTQDVEVSDLGGGESTNIKSSDNSASEDGIGG